MVLEYPLQNLMEQGVEFDIPKSFGVYCPVCKREAMGRFIGIERHKTMNLILYNCEICDDTVSIKSEDLKSKLVRLVA